MQGRARRMNRTTMIFYASWRDAIRTLPDAERLAVYEAAIDFAMSGAEPDLTGMAALAFSFIRQDIEGTVAGYEKMCERNRANGRKGGAPLGNRNAAKNKQDNPAAVPVEETTQNNQEQPSEIKNNPNNPTETETETETETKDKDKIQESVTPQEQAPASLSGADAPDPSEPEEESKINLKSLLAFVNAELAKGKSTMPRLRTIDGTRRAHTLARIREHGEDALREVVRKAAVSDFLNGNNIRGWAATYDWLVLPNNFIKVLEGNYDNKGNVYGDTGKHTQGRGGFAAEDGGYETTL